MKLTIFHGTQSIRNYLLPRARKTRDWYSGMRDVSYIWSHWILSLTEPVTESRYVQHITLKFTPVTTTYSPDGRTILITGAGKQVYIGTLAKRGDDVKETWAVRDREQVRFWSFVSLVFEPIEHETSAGVCVEYNIQSRRRRACAQPYVWAHDTRH